LKERPSKPVTINWSDIRATIDGTPNTDKPSVHSKLPETTTFEPVDQMHDGLSWLDDGLPDFRNTSNRQFDLAAEFDIRQYLDILADSVEGASEVSETGKLGSPELESCSSRLCPQRRRVEQLGKLTGKIR
jgi:hypothetical protein